MAKKKTEEVKKERHVDPTAAAVLNFILWGTGYLYIGKRLLFGIGLLFAMILMHSVILIVGIRWYISIQGLVLIIAHLIFSLVFAYDAHSDAKDN